MELCESILTDAENKNPPNQRMVTPLHFAAEGGHKAICHMLISNADDENPPDTDGNTPLHLAARNGHLEVCKDILDATEDKNMFHPLVQKVYEGLFFNSFN